MSDRTKPTGSDSYIRDKNKRDRCVRTDFQLAIPHFMSINILFVRTALASSYSTRPITVPHLTYAHNSSWGATVPLSYFFILHFHKYFVFIVEMSFFK